MESEPEINKEQEQKNEDLENEPSPSENTGWLPPLSHIQKPAEDFSKQTVPQSQNPVSGIAGQVSPHQQNANGASSSPYGNFQTPQSQEKAHFNVSPYASDQYNPPRYASPMPAPMYGAQPNFYPPFNSLPCMPANPEPVDNSKPLSVLCSRSLTEKEFNKLQSHLGYHTGKTIRKFCILLLLLMLINFAFAAQQGNLRIISISSLIAATVFLLFAIILTVGHRKNIRRLYQLKQSLFSGESVIEIYPDRIVKMSQTKRFVLPYKNVRTFLELPEMMILMDEFKRAVVLRAEDMIPFDVQKVKEIFYPRLITAKKLFKGYFTARLSEPLPIPIIRKEEKILFSFPIKAKPRREKKSKTLNSELLFRIPLMLAFGIVFGTQFASIFWLTKSFVIDIVIYSGILFCAMIILFAVIYEITKITAYRRYKQNDRMSGMALTEQGIVLCIEDETVTLPWNKVIALENKDGIRLELKENEKTLPLYEIQWSDINDRSEFLQCFKEHGSLDTQLNTQTEDNIPPVK